MLDSGLGLLSGISFIGRLGDIPYGVGDPFQVGVATGLDLNIASDY